MSYEGRYHPEEITLLARLSTRLNQGLGLLHETRCKPIAVAIGEGESHWSTGTGPGRDWAVWISGADFGKRADIIHDAVIRFPAAERRRHVLQSWSDVLLVEELDGWTLKLSGNFGIGLNLRGPITEARWWLEYGCSQVHSERPDVQADMMAWVARQNLEPPLAEHPAELGPCPRMSDLAEWLWSQPRLTVEQMLARHDAGRARVVTPPRPFNLLQRGAHA
jgi:hypothetical protein